MVHTLREDMHGRNREREGNLKLECGWCAHYRGANKIILNWQRPLWKGAQELVKRSGWDEPMWVSIHKCMEAMLGISLYSCLYLVLEKRYVFLIISYIFSSTKSENVGNRFCLKAGRQGGGGKWPNNV
jgi:hypothetical protein